MSNALRGRELLSVFACRALRKNRNGKNCSKKPSVGEVSLILYSADSKDWSSILKTVRDAILQLTVFPLIPATVPVRGQSESIPQPAAAHSSYFSGFVAELTPSNL